MYAILYLIGYINIGHKITGNKIGNWNNFNQYISITYNTMMVLMANLSYATL